MNYSFQVRRRRAMSNAERQREFRERNPGYYQRLHAERRAAVKALAEARATAAVATIRTPLALPAPVEAILIPGMYAIPARPTAVREPLPIAVPQHGDFKANRLR